MIIDTHAHYLPQPMLEALKTGASGFPSIDMMHEDDSYKLAFAGGAPTRPIAPKLRDGEARLEWMTGQGVDAQVVGGWLDSFGYEIPDQEGMRWSRFLNEHLLKATDGVDRLAPLCSVPLQNGAMAAEVLQEAMAAGFHGVMIGTQPKGTSGNLDDPDLDPFWEAASGLAATVYIHPMFGCGDPRLMDYDMINAVGRGMDTTTAVARMLFAGHFTRFSGMNVVLSHGGGALPYIMGRLGRNVDAHPGQYADPREEIKGCYYDTVLFDPLALAFLCAGVGPEFVMLGSDYPFPIGDPEPCAVVNNADLGDADKQNILGDTAARLFHVAGCTCGG
jgi:aminocarboxymuconate-semialdehyde decarboxylase